MLDNIYSPFDQFNERQQKVLHLIAIGYGYHRISQILSLPYRAVIKACRSIRNKTGLMEREDIMLYAREHGYGESEVRAC